MTRAKRCLRASSAGPTSLSVEAVAAGPLLCALLMALCLLAVLLCPSRPFLLSSVGLGVLMGRPGLTLMLMLLLSCWVALMLRALLLAVLRRYPWALTLLLMVGVLLQERLCWGRPMLQDSWPVLRVTVLRHLDAALPVVLGPWWSAGPAWGVLEGVLYLRERQLEGRGFVAHRVRLSRRLPPAFAGVGATTCMRVCLWPTCRQEQC